MGLLWSTVAFKDEGLGMSVSGWGLMRSPDVSVPDMRVLGPRMMNDSEALKSRMTCCKHGMFKHSP